jgi:hypothetical protein
MIKPRRMRWAGHEGCEEKWDAYRILVERPEGARHLGRLRRCVRIILKWSLQRKFEVV